MAECPICGGDVAMAEDAVKGEIIECPDCGSELEITDTSPFEVAEAPKEQEDWGQ